MKCVFGINKGHLSNTASTIDKLEKLRDRFKFFFGEVIIPTNYREYAVILFNLNKFLKIKDIR